MFHDVYIHAIKSLIEKNGYTNNNKFIEEIEMMIRKIINGWFQQMGL